MLCVADFAFALSKHQGSSAAFTLSVELKIHGSLHITTASFKDTSVCFGAQPLEVMISGGEGLQLATARQWYQKWPHAAGMTEIERD